MTDNLKYVGRNIPLHDIRQKVTGSMKYLGDMDFGNMLYIKLVLSSIANGKVVKIDTSLAEKVPGVVKIYSFANTPSTKYSGSAWFKDENTPKTETLFSQRVRFVGDRVAAVVAENPEAAKKAAELVKVEYEEYEPVLKMEDYLNTREGKLHEEEPDYYIKEISCGNMEDALEKAYKVFSDEVETQKVHHAAMENHICIAVPHPTEGITVYSPCQIVYGVQCIVAQVLNMPLNRVRVIKVPTGGSFGGKQETVLEPVCAFIAKDLNRAVKMEFERKESILSTRTRNATKGYVKTAVDKDGHIIARDVKVILDAGAYTSGGCKVSIAAGKKSFRLYRIPNQRYKGIIVNTNTPIGGACRGYGSPQIHAITEISIDNVARSMGMDPVDFRLMNLIQPYDEDPTGAPNIGNARIIDCVEKGVSEFKWYERRKADDKGGRYKRGIGMACATHGNGYYGAYHDFTRMNLRMLNDGSLILEAGLHELGCGTIVSTAQIVAEILDVEVSKIHVTEGDTRFSPYDLGSQASRVTYVCGACAKETAKLLKELMLENASKIYKVPKESINMKGGYIWVKGNERTKRTYGDMAAEIQKVNKTELYVSHEYESKANPGSYAAHFAEIIVDTYTGLVRVVDYLAVHDIGKAINPGFVEGQILGGVQMGIGMALYEEIKFDAKGKPINDSFAKYHMVNAPDMPRVKTLLIEEGEDYGPYGAKSIGELCTVPVAPAIVNAVNDALGTRLSSLPLTPEKVLAAIEG